MAEPIEDDRIASLFNEFRAEAGTEILPPGTQAAQQTVRRRRTTRLIGIAALAVGLAGVVLGIANVSGGAPVEPADSHSYGPTLEPAERERLAVEALGTFRYKPPHTARPDLLPIRPGVIFGGLDEHSAGTTYGIGTADGAGAALTWLAIFPSSPSASRRWPRLPWAGTRCSARSC